MATKRRKKPSADGILDAAEKIFAAQGYGETSLRDLMAAAGVSTTAFYARFDSKEAVLDELISRMVQTLSAAFLEATAKASSLEQGFDAAVDVIMTSLLPHRHLVRLFFTEAATSPASREVVRTLNTQLALMLGDRLQKLKERGVVDTSDPNALGWAMLGAMEMQLIRWSVLGDLENDALGPALRATAHALIPRVIAR